MPSTKDAKANLPGRIEVGMSAKFTVSRENLETTELAKAKIRTPGADARAETHLDDRGLVRVGVWNRYAEEVHPRHVLE